MGAHAGPRTPYQALRDGSTGSFWNPRVLSSLWADTAGTTPATVNGEVKRMDDLGGLDNHMLAPTGTRTVNEYTYTFKGPILRKDGNQYYLEFDGDGSGLVATSGNGSWDSVTGTNVTAMTLSVAFQTDSTQPSLPSSGLAGTWLGSGSLGNFGSVWWFGLRLNQETMFYATVRNAENTAWVTQWNENQIYSNLSTAQYLDKKIIYTAVGTIDNATFGAKEWVEGVNTLDTSGNAFNATTELPVPFNSSFSIGARAPTNDNWIAGRFYGGTMINKEISESERIIIENYLYTSCFE